jgi:hypothetical protein
MRRQLRANGGITNARQMAAFGGIMGSDGRKQYGIGSWLKEKIRKLIPNELANIAVKAAPFVAPFNPAIAAGMAGLGSFDKTGRIGSSLKSAGMTYGGGQLARYAGGAGFQGNPFSADGGAFRGGLEGIKGGFTSPLGTDTGFKLGTKATDPTGKVNSDVLNRTMPGDPEANIYENITSEGAGLKDAFQTKVRDATGLFKDVPILKELPALVQQQILVGGVTSAGTYLYNAFIADYPEPEEGEDMVKYLEERRQRVGTQMRNYFDNYFKFDKEYSAMTPEQKNAEVARYNKNQGGLMRQNYQTGGISMSNTMAQNKAINDARRIQNQNMLEAARGRLPGYQAPPKAMPIDAPTKIIQPGGPANDLEFTKQPYVAPAPDGSLPPIAELDKIREQVLKEQENDPFEMRLREEERIRQEGTMGPISLDDFEPQNPNPPTARIIQPTLPVEPMTGQNIMEGYAKYKEQNPEIGMGASIQVIINGRLPDGTPLQFNNGAQAAAFNQYLESIGQPPFERTQNPIESKDGSGLAKLAVGGRVGQNMGGLMRLNYMIGGEAKQMEAGAPPIMYSGNMDPNAQAGLPSVPGPMQMAEDGPEFDMREKGGFQPLGRQEGKDDVPAMLAKNEFVMTADAVRAAGGGSIQKGAQKMYNTMKKLESRVS